MVKFKRNAKSILQFCFGDEIGKKTNNESGMEYCEDQISKKQGFHLLKAYRSESNSTTGTSQVVGLPKIPSDILKTSIHFGTTFMSK